ncbi:MAG: OmpA family protein [Cyclobacteriaceae bacterium]
MSRALLSMITFAFVAIGSSSAQNDVLVNVTGKVLSAKDSSAVSTSVLYEKLPYYDDMGLVSSNGSGEFAFSIVKDVAYNISISKDAFIPFTEEIKVSENNKELVFYLQSDAEDEIIRLDNVIFARGSDVLQQESYAELDQIHDMLRANNDLVIQLEGHTDFAGNPQANMALSQARVESVKKYLTRGGINKNRVLTKAFGGTQPLYQERTAEAMAKNRRVEVRIIKK